MEVTSRTRTWTLSIYRQLDQSVPEEIWIFGEPTAGQQQVLPGDTGSRCGHHQN
jgi:hypothetical protein